MRRDYEQHFVECSHCSSRLKFHRTLDVSLAVLTSLAVMFFLFALATIMHVKPMEHVAFKILNLDIVSMYQMLVSAAIAGVCFSFIAFLLVLTATPVPSYLSGIAAERVKLIEEHLPSTIRSRSR
jgi:ABC-type multidrug transport system permease subunit